MFSTFFRGLFPVPVLLKTVLDIGLKHIKYFVDSTFREQVSPVPGSVLYSDLWVAVEHSGIYVGDHKISNIVVDGLAESSVSLSSPESFTSKSTLGRKIYVSCDRHGAVGHHAVAAGASQHVGERAFYGLVFKNCHQFSSKCVNYAETPDSANALTNLFHSLLPDGSWEFSIKELKKDARLKLGATKWRLWDWNQEQESDPVPEPDWQAHADHFKNQALNPQSIAQIRAELFATQEYEAEIEDEDIPSSIKKRIATFRLTLNAISDKYEEVKDFLAIYPGAHFSYADLQTCAEDFSALARILSNNTKIKELARKMGRNYISEEKKKQGKVPQASKSEVYGTHLSDDVMRLLPGELVNLEDDTLETLFYARLLEKNLLTYELQGVTFSPGEEVENVKKCTGPVVACLDTSGSMYGEPLLKAKALLLAITAILKQEDRSLHLLLFGAAGEIHEFSVEAQHEAAGLLSFLQQGFGGGTHFETPLRHAIGIIAGEKNYQKADILMITDGDCDLSKEAADFIETQKKLLDFSIYSVNCAGTSPKDAFSDEIIVL